MADVWRDEVRRIDEGLADFLDSLHDPACWGRFAPARAGLAPLADEIGLGFSCRALHLALASRLWDAVLRADRERWLDYIRAFQDADPDNDHPIAAGAFCDLARLEYDPRRDRARRWRGLAWRRWRPGDPLDDWPRLVLRETAMATAALSAAAARPYVPYQSFPYSAEAAGRTLLACDWEGGAGPSWALDLGVVLVTQAGQFRDLTEITAARLALAEGLVAHQDAGTALWTRAGSGHCDARALEVAATAIRALDWLRTPAPRPADLLDACLRLGPGDTLARWCDWAQIVYACALVTTHRRRELREACGEVAARIAGLRQADGGLGASRQGSSTHFLGRAIGDGRLQGDLLATAAGVDALARLLAVLEDECVSWDVVTA